jgi:serine/threonine protein kinase
MKPGIPSISITESEPLSSKPINIPKRTKSSDPPNISSYISGESHPYSTFRSDFTDDPCNYLITNPIQDKRKSYLPIAQIEQKMNVIEREVELVMKLDHENIIRYYGIKREENNLLIFLEYVPGGSIRQLIKKFGNLSEKLVKKFTKQILCGLNYLHERNIVHGDIKCDNILVDTHSRVKLADFGSSREIKEDQPIKLVPLVGTPNFMAPEIVMQTEFGISSDIWSLGCAVIEMFSGSPPFHELTSVASIMFKIASLKDIPPFPDEKNILLSKDAKDFLMACFVHDPKQRPTAKDLLEHHWIKEFEVKFDVSSPVPSMELFREEFQEEVQ